MEREPRISTLPAVITRYVVAVLQAAGWHPGGFPCTLVGTYGRVCAKTGMPLFWQPPFTQDLENADYRGNACRYCHLAQMDTPPIDLVEKYNALITAADRNAWWKQLFRVCSGCGGTFSVGIQGTKDFNSHRLMKNNPCSGAKLIKLVPNEFVGEFQEKFIYPMRSWERITANTVLDAVPDRLKPLNIYAITYQRNLVFVIDPRTWLVGADRHHYYATGISTDVLATRIRTDERTVCGICHGICDKDLCQRRIGEISSHYIRGMSLFAVPSPFYPGLFDIFTDYQLAAASSERQRHHDPIGYRVLNVIFVPFERYYVPSLQIPAAGDFA